MAESRQLLELSAGEAVERMSRGEITVEHYANVLLERCKLASALNAFITLEPDRVLEEARACDRLRQKGGKTGPLFGLPIPVKDSVNTKDYPTTAGTPALRHFRPAEDAPVVQALRDGGAIVLGKTNLHELSFGYTCNNVAFGAVHNPYDPRRIPGGSSGGTAVAVAAHMAPLGVAEDTEGSIRVPAALCGISGFRPTTGRYPTGGCVPISPLFDQVGPHARTVSDLCLFDAVVANDGRPLEATLLKGVRFGVAREYFFTDLDPEVERLTNLALQRLKDSGAEIIETELPGLQHLLDFTTDVVQYRDERVAVERYLREYHTGLTFDELVKQASPDIQKIFRQYAYPLSDEIFMLWETDPANWAPQNHSCDPNTAFDGLNVVATRVISRDAELTLDYGAFLSDQSEPFTCHCNAAACRGTIMGTKGNSVSARERGAKARREQGLK